MRKYVLAIALVFGCGGSEEPFHKTPGAAVSTTLSPARVAELSAIQAQLDAVKDLDAAGFAAKFRVPFVTDLGYDPLTAKSLDLVKASSVALNETEEAALQANGFVITDRHRFPSFVYGYQTIYTADLPVYVSADSILFAVHKSYDAMLESLETSALSTNLRTLLDAMRTSLGNGGGRGIDDAVLRDVDVYLAVAKGLLADVSTAPVAGGDAGTAKSLFEKAHTAQGTATVTLFGNARDEDFSQFTPRGHYTNSPELSAYFRAMMWLGRIDFRLIEPLPDGKQVFRRNQVEAAYVLRSLIDQGALANWKVVDATIEGFVGEQDSMRLPQLDALLSDLKLTSAVDLAKVPDSVIAQAIVTGSYGAQRIASHLMVNGLGSGTLPLSSSFLLFGQRYTVDSHVFSNVVYDRVAHGTVQRMMPNPLDVGFAALGNDQAGMLSNDELVKYRYAPDLASMRILVDAHPSEFWDASLYNDWLSMVRVMSPTKEVANPSAVGLPRITGTEAWGRRILSAQLASWAELRHDTILYAKQLFIGAASCEYPDAYVEPYPELFARLGAFAARGTTLMNETQLPGSGPFLEYFDRLRSAAATLEAMAKNERAGASHTAEQLAFINQLTFEKGCGTPSSFDGWYAKLFFHQDSALTLDPTIADVLTQPTDETGNPVGKVLHVGTAMPRTMVVTVESCSGPHAYVGLASSYHERITENFQRLADEDWVKEVSPTSPPDVPWLVNVVTR